MVTSPFTNVQNDFSTNKNEKTEKKVYDKLSKNTELFYNYKQA